MCEQQETVCRGKKNEQNNVFFFEINISKYDYENATLRTDLTRLDLK